MHKVDALCQLFYKVVLTIEEGNDIEMIYVDLHLLGSRN